jgi:hypothetical protein
VEGNWNKHKSAACQITFALLTYHYKKYPYRKTI